MTTLKKALEDLNTLKYSIEYIEEEHNANYVICKPDKMLIDDAIKNIELYLSYLPNPENLEP